MTPEFVPYEQALSFQMVSIFCNKEFEHISSSGIRTLSKYGSDKIKDYLLE